MDPTCIGSRQQQLCDLCRCCGCRGAKIPIYKYRHLFKSMTSLKLSTTEGLPTNVCRRCLKKMRNTQNFKYKCLETFVELLSISNTRRSEPNASNVEKSSDDEIPPYENETLEVELNTPPKVETSTERLEHQRPCPDLHSRPEEDENEYPVELNVTMDKANQWGEMEVELDLNEIF